MSGAASGLLSYQWQSTATTATYTARSGWLPTADMGYLLRVDVANATGTPTTPTVAGSTGLAWPLVGVEGDSNNPWRITAVYKASKPSGLSSGTITIASGDATTYKFCDVQLYELPGVDPGTDGANIIVTGQFASGDSGNVAVGSRAPALPSPVTAGTDNIVFLFASAHRLVDLTIAEAGWVKLAETSVGSGFNETCATWWNDSLDQGTTINVSVDGSAGATADTAKVWWLIVEVAAALVPDPQPATPTPSYLWEYTSGADAITNTPATSFLPVVGTVVVAAVLVGALSGTFGATTLTHSGTGLTMTKLATVNPKAATPEIQGEVWYGVPTGTPTTGTFSYGTTSTADWCLISVLDAIDIATAGPIVGYAIDDSSDALVSDLTVDYATTFEVGGYNRPLAIFFTDHDGHISPSTSPAPTWTKLGEVLRVSGGGTIGAFWYDGQDTTAKAFVVTDAEAVTTGRMAGVFIELRGTEGATNTPIAAGDDAIPFDDAGIDFSLSAAETIDVAEELVISETPPPGGGGAPSPGVPFGGGAITVLDLTVRVRDANLNLLGEADDISGLWLILRHGDVRSWVLEVPADGSPAAEKVARWLLADNAGVVIERHGLPILSGTVEVSERMFDNGAERLRVAGDDDTGILRSIICLPAPDAPYTAAEYDVRTGPAETLMHGYVSDNGGPTAPVLRQQPLLVMDVDQGRGGSTSSGGGDDPDPGESEITEYVRMHTGLDVCQRISKRTGLGFYVIQVATDDGPRKMFSVYAPVDRSDVATFGADLGNLATYTYTETRPKATVVYVGGQGEGTARLFVERVNPVGLARWGRIEAFVDRRDLPDAVQLAAAGDLALTEMGSATRLELGVIDTPLLQYGAHYNVGDIVAVAIEDVAPDEEGDPVGARIVDVVRQVTLTYTGEDGEVVTPQVGDSPLSPSLHWARTNDHDRRISALERT